MLRIYLKCFERRFQRYLIGPVLGRSRFRPTTKTPPSGVGSYPNDDKRRIGSSASKAHEITGS